MRYAKDSFTYLFALHSEVSSGPRRTRRVCRPGPNRFASSAHVTANGFSGPRALLPTVLTALYTETAASASGPPKRLLVLPHDSRIMVAFKTLTRSLTDEPGDEHISDLRIIPFSESPWVTDLPKEDADRLERIAPSTSRGKYASVSTGEDSEEPSSHSRSTSYYAEAPALPGIPSYNPGYSTPYDGDSRTLYSATPQPYSRTPSFANPALASPGIPLLPHSYPPAGATPQFVAFPEPQHYDAVLIRQRLDEKSEEDKSGPPQWLGIVNALGRASCSRLADEYHSSSTWHGP